jgi:hypothetical protein
MEVYIEARVDNTIANLHTLGMCPEQGIWGASLLPKRSVERKPETKRESEMKPGPNVSPRVPVTEEILPHDNDTLAGQREFGRFVP